MISEGPLTEQWAGTLHWFLLGVHSSKKVLNHFRMLVHCLASIQIASKAKIAYFQIISTLQTVIGLLLYPDTAANYKSSHKESEFLTTNTEIKANESC